MFQTGKSNVRTTGNDRSVLLASMRVKSTTGMLNFRALIYKYWRVLSAGSVKRDICLESTPQSGLHRFPACINKPFPSAFATARKKMAAHDKNFDIPKRYKAVVYDNPGTISTKIVEMETPEPGHGEVLVRMYASVSLGKPGTFQQYVVSSAFYVTPIPDGLDPVIAAPMLCAGITVFSALNRCDTRPGQWVVISGAGGGLGHIACQLGSRGMAFRIIGVDHGSKEGLVRESGAEEFIDVTKFDDKTIAEEVKRLTGGKGATAAISCTSSNRAYSQALSMLTEGGTLVCAGVPEGTPQEISGAFPSNMIGRCLTIRGVSMGNKKDAIEIMDFAARRVVKPHCQVEKMENLTAVFKEMSEGKLMGRKRFVYDHGVSDARPTIKDLPDSFWDEVASRSEFYF
ncbi:MAG: hypothetical protein Q9157_001922 [Trypethelium eluteriae]